MKTDTFKGATLCSSDRTHLWLTWHLLPLSVTQPPPPPNTSVAFWRRPCVRGTWICKDANAVPSRSWQPQTAWRQNCSAFLSKTSFKATGISQNGCLEKAVCLLNAPYTFLLICMRNDGKKQLGNDSYLLPLQSCRDEILPLVENGEELDICFRGLCVRQLAGEDGQVKAAEPGG